MRPSTRARQDYRTRRRSLILAGMALTGWAVHIVYDSEPFDIGGLDPWAYLWTTESGTVEVEDPEYAGTRHDLPVRRIETPDTQITFAADEIALGVWLFAIHSQPLGMAAVADDEMGNAQ
jgi:hypothetical protein